MKKNTHVLGLLSMAGLEDCSVWSSKGPHLSETSYQCSSTHSEKRPSVYDNFFAMHLKWGYLKSKIKINNSKL